MKKKIITLIVLVLVVMQFFTIDKIPFVEAGKDDLFAIEEASDEVKNLIQNNCYDCHSDQINYPWYTNVAPVSWWVGDHIEHGHEHLNFSVWGSLPVGKKAHKAEEAYEEVEEGEMPLESYTIMHSEANLNEDQKALLVNWFKGLEEKYKE